jgi:hypothetical protein
LILVEALVGRHDIVKNGRQFKKLSRKLTTAMFLGLCDGVIIFLQYYHLEMIPGLNPVFDSSIEDRQASWNRNHKVT